MMAFFIVCICVANRGCDIRNRWRPDPLCRNYWVRNTDRNVHLCILYYSDGFMLVTRGRLRPARPADDYVKNQLKTISRWLYIDLCINYTPQTTVECNTYKRTISAPLRLMCVYRAIHSGITVSISRYELVIIIRQTNEIWRIIIMVKATHCFIV